MDNISDSLIIFGATYLLFLMIGLIFLYFMKQSRERQKQMIVSGIGVCILAFLLSRLASQIYYDPRPFVSGNFVPLIPHDSDNGFPSDHTLLASSLALIISYFNRNIGKLFLIVAGLIGVSRVLAGVHNPIDIVGSMAISIIAFFAIYRLILPMIAKIKKDMLK